LDLSSTAARELIAEPVLSERERIRAGGMLLPRRRQEFTAMRSLLRLLLSDYLGREVASEIGLRENPHGKPLLPRAEIQFNLAHSGHWGVLCFAGEGRIGVDVERKSDREDLSRMAVRSFSAAELAGFEALPAEQRRDVFFRVWTRKEAFVKAHGRGIGLGLKQFDVSLGAAARSRLVATRVPGDDPDRWQFADLDFGPHYAASLCLECRAGRRLLISQYEWRGERRS
jgi:4'-phosphopantetheinyl transferase